MDKKALEQTAKANYSEFSCSNSGGAAERGALGPFGLLVLADDDLSEHTPVYFYIVKEYDGNLKTLFCTDQSRYFFHSVLSKCSFRPIFKQIYMLIYLMKIGLIYLVGLLWQMM